jgi:hypothetical protein
MTRKVSKCQKCDVCLENGNVTKRKEKSLTQNGELEDSRELKASLKKDTVEDFGTFMTASQLLSTGQKKKSRLV